MSHPTFSDAHVRTAGEILLFPSRIGGDHSKGVAQVAMKLFGAVMGVDEGLTGECYAFPIYTKDGTPRSLLAIAEAAALFAVVAQAHPELRFFIPRIGWGSTEYTDGMIASCFRSLPPNVRIPPEWEHYATRQQPACTVPA